MTICALKKALVVLSLHLLLRGPYFCLFMEFVYLKETLWYYFVVKLPCCKERLFSQRDACHKTKKETLKFIVLYVAGYINMS